MASNLPAGISGVASDTNYNLPANVGQTDSGYYSNKAVVAGVGGAVVSQPPANINTGYYGPNSTQNATIQGGGLVVNQTGLPANTPINSSSVNSQAPLTIPQTGTQSPASSSIYNPSVPTGATVDSNGNAIVNQPNQGEQNRNSLNDLINQLGTKGQTTLNLQNQYGLDTKIQNATNSYNAYNQEKVKSDQQIQNILNNTGLTRDQATSQAQEVQRLNNANLANLAVIANMDAGNLTAAQNTIQAKLDAQFKPIEEQITARTQFANSINNNLTASEQKTIDFQNQQKAADATSVRTAASDINQRLSQNQAPQSVYSAVDSIVQQYTSGQISATEATNRMYQATGQYGSTNKFLSVNAGYDPKTGQPIQRIFDTVHGRFLDGQRGPNPTPANSTPVGQPTTGTTGTSTPAVSPALGVTNANGASFAQYGNLAKTDFNPNDIGDSRAYTYLQHYLNDGKVPEPGDVVKGQGAQAGIMYTNAQTRALSLYFQATGQPLPSPAVIKNNISLINTNNDLGNRLVTQEETVKANVDLSLANMTKNGLNSSSFAPLNGLIDTAKSLFNDPSVGQFLSQNATIQNELGSLLAVKNASGTTVYDKLQSAGIIGSTDTPEVMKQKVDTLLQEAQNFSTALNKVNGELYKKIDPLMINPDNPNRQAAIAAQNSGFLTEPGTGRKVKISDLTPAQLKEAQDAGWK